MVVTLTYGSLQEVSTPYNFPLAVSTGAVMSEQALGLYT